MLSGAWATPLAHRIPATVPAAATAAPTASEFLDIQFVGDDGSLAGSDTRRSATS